ncbi:ComEC/Rec2 family competence protein, partial [Candidatus Parcubacteria bacterium]|nr:ComEC/Rec2 family competence protein [Candidatus Parcubacteria bacterium]
MTKSKYFLLSCISFVFGIAIGSFVSVQIWILFLVVGFSISLIFLLKGGNIILDNDNLAINKNIFSSDKLKIDENIPPDKGGWGVEENNLLSPSNKKMKIFFLLLIFFSLGLIRIESSKFNAIQIVSIENFDEQKIKLEGIILQSSLSATGKQKIIIEDIKTSGFRNDTFESGKIIIYLEKYPEYNLGDEISFEGKLNIPEDFDGFEYKNYLLAKGIYYIEYYPKVELVKKAEEDVYIKIANYRKSAAEVVRKIYSQPQAGIINAMVLGEKSDLSDETLESFNRTGTRHIIAISGLHMTIIGILIMYLLLAIGLNRNYAFYLAVMGIGFYVALVGFPVSAMRASVMSVLILIAVKFGRLSSAGNTIIFAGLLMLIFDPNLLRYDTGFQLSFSAVLGIIYIYPKFDHRLKKYSDFLKIKTMFLITLSAQIATLPIVLSSFEQYSVFSVLANVLVLPAVPVVMVGGIISIIA